MRNEDFSSLQGLRLNFSFKYEALLVFRSRGCEQLHGVRRSDEQVRLRIVEYEKQGLFCPCFKGFDEVKLFV